MHLTIFSVRLIALLAVIAAVLVAFSSVGPGTPREASATDKKMELQFFELNNAGKNWTAANVNAMLGTQVTPAINTANAIWAPAGITFAWPKDPTITALADPQPAVGNKGDVKTPAASNKVQILRGDATVGYAPDVKTPSEVDKVCIAANEQLNANQFPVILIQDFVDSAGTAIDVLGLSLVNLSGQDKLETTQGVAGNQIGAGLCILIAQDAQTVEAQQTVKTPTFAKKPAPGKVLAHELGHAMCLPSDTDRDNLMFPFIRDGAAKQTGLDLTGDQIVQKTESTTALLCNKKVQEKLDLDLTGVSCNDVWLDISALIALAVDPDLPLESVLPLGVPHDDTDLLVGKAITRLDPSQKQKGAWDVTTVTYLGPEIEGFEPPETQFDFALGELIPDKPPTKLDCQQKGAVVSGGAEVTNHKLTWMDVTPNNQPPPWNRVEVLVLTNGGVKNMLFTCQNTGEKVIVTEPKEKIATVEETWSADFVQKCITESSGVSLVINWVGAALSPGLEPDCFFSNDPPPSLQPCIVSNAPVTPKTGAEKGIMDPDVKFSAVSNKRGSNPSKIVNKDIDDDPLTPDVPVLISRGWAFSEASKVWIRTDTEATLINSGPGAKNLGTVVLYLGTSSPSDPNDGTTCKILDDTIVFPSILESHSRDASTDFPGETKNVPAITSGALVIDPDGPTNPSKTDKQIQDTDDLLQDDWDGDGCPDWDELDKDFINGRDPFNPNDCSELNDLTGTYNILATIAPAAKTGEISADPIALVKVEEKTVIKDGKHLQVDLLVSNFPDQALKNNQKVYWDTDDVDQVGWWQVKQGSIVQGGPQPTATPTGDILTDKTVTLNRLIVQPCGGTTTNIPETAAAAPGMLWGVVCNGIVEEGSYFHCIARVDEVNNVLDGNVTCYIDSAGLSSLPPVSAVPSFADGNAGAPPPPPYGTGAPNELSGTVDTVNQRIIIEACFTNIGGFLGPNVVVRLNTDAHSLKGFTQIWAKRSIAECDAKAPNDPNEAPFLQVETVLARQNINFDHDDDGCSDYDELGHGKTPGPAKKNCGDDPYNPYDSDTDFSGPSSTLATVTRADSCSKGLPSDPCAGVDTIPGNADDLADGTPVPGAYYHCIANNISTGVNTYDTPIYCYIDFPTVLVNPQASPLFGDGLPGSPPPEPFGDMDDSHSVLTTVYDKTNNRLRTEGCFLDEDGQGALGDVWVVSNVDAHTGLGTVDIYILQDFGNPGCGANPPTGMPATADLEVVEQPPGWDSDQDSCTDATELGQIEAAGGLRDPYNQWDFIDTWATGSQTGNVDAFDIGDVVNRFGAVGDPSGDPHVAPTGSDNYHTSADRGPPILGARKWTLPAPSGNIDAFDIGDVVNQFGHVCP